VRAPHMLLRCNNQNPKRTYIVNQHHHAVSRCGEETSKGNLVSAICTMDACNIEGFLTLTLNPPMTLKETSGLGFPVFPIQQNFPNRHQSHPDGMLNMPRKRQVCGPQTGSHKGQGHLVEFVCSDINPQQASIKSSTNIYLLSSVYKQGASEASLETTKSLFMLYFLESGAHSTISAPQIFY